MPCSSDYMTPTESEIKEQLQAQLQEIQKLQHMLKQLANLFDDYNKKLPASVRTWANKAHELDPSALNISLDRTTQLLCLACREAEKNWNANALKGVKGLYTWWRNHKAFDARRRATER